MTENVDVQISIKQINEVAFNIKPLPLPIEEIAFGKNLSIGLGFNFSISPESNIFKLLSLVKYSMIESDVSIMELETEIIFEIQNLSGVVKTKEDNQLEIKDDFLSTLVGVAIGTTRGVLASNTKGNPLSQIPLPILNPNDVMKGLKK